MSIRSPKLAMTLGAGAVLLLSSVCAYAQVQSSDQQKCLNAVNKDGAAESSKTTQRILTLLYAQLK